MAVTFADYIRFMQTASVFNPIARFDFLNPDETVYQSFSAEVTGGSLTANRANGVRRTCNINVNNIYNTFTPNPLTFWVNQKFQLSLGYNINGEDYFIPQGIFGLKTAETLHVKSQKEATINGIDKFGFLDGQMGGRLISIYSLPIATNIVAAIKDILVESAVNDPKAPLLIIDAAETTPYTIYKEYGSSYGELVLELNNILASNMFYGISGRLICEPDVLNSIKDSKWDFNTDSQVYLGIVQAHKIDEAYNVVLVVGDNVEGNIAIGVARNDDPSSPLSTLRIGEKVAPPITDTVIDTDERAQARAEYELKRYASLAIGATITCIPLFHLDC